VQGLNTWLTDNGDTYIQNLTEKNLSQETADKINFITAVDTSTFTVVDSTLNLKEISADKVVGLTDLNTKVGNLETALNQLKSDVDDEITGLVAVNTKIANLETSLNNYVTKVDFNKTVGNLDALLASNTTIIKQIEDINSRLTWQELNEL
jgi:predicted  nucleic acid-binding Zn-ribbon protein